VDGLYALSIYVWWAHDEIAADDKMLINLHFAWAGYYACPTLRPYQFSPVHRIGLSVKEVKGFLGINLYSAHASNALFVTN